jgi:hypothetical protein
MRLKVSLGTKGEAIMRLDSSDPGPETLGRHDPIDVGAEGTRATLWIFVLILFLVSAWFARGELRYVIWGRTAEAQVLRTYQMTGRHNVTYHYVESQYLDAAGHSVTDNDGISADWQSPLSGKVKVSYISGETRPSRLAAHQHYLAIMFFAVCVAALAFVVIKWWREGDEVARELNRDEE